MQRRHDDSLRAAAALVAAAACLACLAPTASASVLINPVPSRNFTVDFSMGGTVKLGALLPLINFWGGQPGTNEYVTALQLLVEDVNSGAIPGLLPNTTLELVLADEGIVEGDETFFGVSSLVAQGAAAIVGPVFPGDTTSSAAYASSRMGVNLVGSSSQASALSDAAKYPYYSRTAPSFGTQAESLATYMRGLGWQRAIVFSAISEDTTEYLHRFTDGAASAGIELLPPVQFPLEAASDPDQMALYFQLLKDSGARVIVYMVPRTQSLKLMEMMRVSGLGLFGNEYSYVMPSVSQWDLADNARYVEVWGAMVGTLFVSPLTMDVADDAVRPFNNRLAQRMYGVDWQNGQAFDAYSTHILYDTALLTVRALHFLIQTKRGCSLLPPGFPGAPDECVALWSDASDDDSIRRLIRSVPLMPLPQVGLPVSGQLTNDIYLDPTTGDRMVPLTSLQFQDPVHGRQVDSTSVQNFAIAVTAVILPDGTVLPSPVPGAKYSWQDKSEQTPADRATLVEDHERVATATYAAMASLAALAAGLCVFCLALTLYHRKLPIMRMSSYRVNCLSTVGGLAMLSFVFLGRMELTGGLCTAKIWLASLGFTLLFGPMFAKLWRIHRIFGQKQIRSVKITDRQLFEVVALLVAADAALLGLWSGLSPQEVKETALAPVPTEDPNLLVSTVQDECASDLDGPFYAALLALKGALLLGGSYMAYTTRKVKIKALNDAKWIGLSVYTTSMIALLTVPVVFLVGNGSVDASFVLMSGPAVIVVSSAMALLFMPKFVAIWTGTTEEWTKANGGTSKLTQQTNVAGPRLTPMSGSQPGATTGSGAGDKLQPSPRARPHALEVRTAGLPSVRGAAYSSSQPGSPLSPADAAARPAAAAAPPAGAECEMTSQV